MTQWWKGIGLFPNSSLPSFQEWAKIRTFPIDIKDKAHITEEYEDLKERLEAVFDNPALSDQLDEEDEKAASNFLNHWKFLYDERTNQEKIRETIQNFCLYSGGSYDSEMAHYYPEEYNKKLPKGGGWIIVTTDIPVAPANKPHLFGVYFAKNASRSKYITVEFINNPVHFQYYMVQITTEAGDVSLNPHEYMIVSDMKEILGSVGKEFDMIKLGGDTNYDQAKVHYLATRGIPQYEAYDMLLGSVNSTKFAYFKLRPECEEMYTFFFDCYARGIRPEMAERLWAHKLSGKPLFKVRYMKEGKEVSQDEFESERSKNRQEKDPGEHKDAS